MKRREALKKLGLTTAAVYTAPIILKLDRAQAIQPTPCPPRNGDNGNSNGGGPPRCR